jgi:hypothetical protein
MERLFHFKMVLQNKHSLHDAVMYNAYVSCPHKRDITFAVTDRQLGSFLFCSFLLGQQQRCLEISG